jgi:hypothetical protein
VLFRPVIRTLRIFFHVGLYVGLQAIPALAGDWSVKSSQSETFEANDNYFLLRAPKGITYAPLSTASVDVLARTPTTRYDLHGDIGYYHYFGAGAADAALTNVKQKGASFYVEHAGNAIGDKVSLTAWSQQQDLATAQLNDIGAVTAGGGEISTSGVAGNLHRQLNAIDSLSLSATSTKVDFASSSAVPSVNLTTGAVWNRRVDPSTDLIASTELNWTVQDNQARLDTKLWKAVTGAQLRPTSRLSLTGSVGIGVVTSGQDGPAGIVALPPSPLPTPGSLAAFAGSGTSIGLLADVQAIYRLRKTTDLSLSASRSIAPDVLGALSQRTSYAVGLTHAVNSVSNLSFGGALTRLPASGGQLGSGTSNFWTANVSYSRLLSREWRTQLTYSYRRRDDEAGSVSSNAVALVLARDLTLLP